MPIHVCRLDQTHDCRSSFTVVGAPHQCGALRIPDVARPGEYKTTRFRGLRISKSVSSRIYFRHEFLRTEATNCASSQRLVGAI